MAYRDFQTIDCFFEMKSMKLCAVHICIIQPVGYVHSLGFLDQARYFRYQFRRMGAEVSLAKNRLRKDAVNFVFGAHLGFDPKLRLRYCCLFVNLEQFGVYGAKLPLGYKELLSTSRVVDYHLGNAHHYAKNIDDVLIISFGYAPYLTPSSIPWEERSIDLLFIGSMNERRLRFLRRIELLGLSVKTMNAPIFCDERDDLMRDAKAILNFHYYESAIFEQARAFHALSLGVAVISEKVKNSVPPIQFEDSVFWVEEEAMESFFIEVFQGKEFAKIASLKIDNFKTCDSVGEYAKVLDFASGYFNEMLLHLDADCWRPDNLQLGSGRDYKLGWLNVDIQLSTQPDVVLDLSQDQVWPLCFQTPLGDDVELNLGSLSLIYANNVLEHVQDLPGLMTNCLRLLKEGGKILIEVPYEHAPSAWQDPTHVRAMNEKSWIYYTDWFWYLGWFEWRFKLERFQYLDINLKPCEKSSANFMRIFMSKVSTTAAERVVARAMRADFGGVPDDLHVFK